MLNFTDFLWSYKISVSVQIYRDCNLQRKCGHLTEILPTFLKSVNGSSFPVNVTDVTACAELQCPRTIPSAVIKATKSTTSCSRLHWLLSFTYIDLAKPRSGAPVSNPRTQYSVHGNNYASAQSTKLIVIITVHSLQ